MKFNTGNNNSRDVVNVNTRGIQFMNSEGHFPSTLQVGYWNEMLSFKINPALEKSQQTETKKFDYEKVISTAITLEKATILAEKIEREVLPAFYNNTEIFKGVPVGGDSLVGVGTKNMDGEMIAYFAIFKSLDENTKKPEVSMIYEFRSGYTVDNYNPQTGEFSISKNIPSELILFMEVLKSARSGLTNAIAHSIRFADKFSRDRIHNQLDEIAAKLGVSGKFKSNSGSYKTKDVFSSSVDNSSVANDLEEAPMTTLGNIDDIEEFMK